MTERVAKACERAATYNYIGTGDDYGRWVDNWPEIAQAAIAAYRDELADRGLCIVKRETLRKRFREEYEHDGYSPSGAEHCAGADVQAMIAAGESDVS